MKPVYLDLHIHSSDNPNSLNENYNLDTLIKKIREKAQGDDFLISITDHNTINEKVYQKAIQDIKDNLILGVELHIQTHRGEDSKAYHCHIYFNFDNDELNIEKIKNINFKLDKLYTNKEPKLVDDSIPTIQDIIEAFDEYDFILLPHGGQTHATFDTSIPEGKEFDNAIQRSIYYNFFDGFTSRSDKKTEETKSYFEKIGVSEFVNLLTGTDSYDPSVYPKPKNEETYKFIPTWMFATPTFSGLRLSLSDNSRLVYSQEKPKKWKESIESAKLKNNFVDIDINFTPGLNVIIGESSSGKTLLVDSLYRKLTDTSFIDSKYKKYGVENIQINYPENLDPHFIEQNFVISVTREDKKINDIEIIKKILPENNEAGKRISKGLQDLNNDLKTLFNTVENIEMLEDKIKRIPVISSLITIENIKDNILKNFLDTISNLKNSNYDKFDFDDDIESLEGLDEKLTKNPFIKHDKKLIDNLKREIQEMRDYSVLQQNILNTVKEQKEKIDLDLIDKNGESHKKKKDFESLIDMMSEYYSDLNTFHNVLKKISEYSIKSYSEKVIVEGYELSIENLFKLDKNIIKDELNNLLLSEKNIPDFKDITPEKLFKDNFKKNKKGVQKGSDVSYKTIIENINNSFIEQNEIRYKILTPDKKDFDNLSPGLKTAIILELILNYEGDSAPLIIDQPEDNLATSYMNDGLVKSIKKMKNKKQIIFVSHNATIPMAGDAQNIILCENDGGNIKISSNFMESKINNIDVVDHIARIADGGKPSIKKRFKKYNLKKYK